MVVVRLPIAAATGVTAAANRQGRARRLTFVSMAGIAGFLLGPMLGVFVTRFAANVFTLAMPAGSIAIPLAATALLAFVVAAAVAFAVPSVEGNHRLRRLRPPSWLRTHGWCRNCSFSSSSSQSWSLMMLRLGRTLLGRRMISGRCRQCA